MTLSFSKQIQLHVKRYNARMDEVVKDSVAILADAAQDAAPEVTGALRDSLEVWLNGQLIGKGRDAYLSASRQMQAGDVITIAWTAPHAPLVEYGGPGRRAYFFVRGTAQRWPQIVAEAAGLNRR